MIGTTAPQSEPEGALWDELMRVWQDDHVACRRELALEYTQKYPENVWGWVVLADSLANLALYEEGLAALRRAQSLAPPDRSADILVQYGHFCSTANNLEEAENCYRRAVETKESTSNFVYLAATLASLGRFEEAKRYYLKAIEIGDGAIEEAEYNLGLVFRAERNYPVALEHLEKALKLDPEYRLAKEAIDDLRLLAELRKRT